MSNIYIVFSNDPVKAQAGMENITGDEVYRVLRRGKFPLIQAEDLDNGNSLDSGGERYCIVFELETR